MARFDRIMNNAYRVVANLYSEVGVWFPPDDAPTQTENIFFIEPTKRDGYGQSGTFVKNIANFNVDAPVVEYLKGQWSGLKEAADAKQATYIEVLGARFKVARVKASFDGKTLFAELTKTA